MAHKVMVDGTVYDVTGGKTLIDGTEYSIKSGKTLVDGTVYEVGLAEMVTVTLTGTGRSSCTKVTIDGTSYWTGGETIEVPVGSVISLWVGWTDSDIKDEPHISLYKNGVYHSKLRSGEGSYDYTVIGNTSITMGYIRETIYMSSEYSGYMLVYEE